MAIENVSMATANNTPDVYKSTTISSIRVSSPFPNVTVETNIVIPSETHQKYFVENNTRLNDKENGTNETEVLLNSTSIKHDTINMAYNHTPITDLYNNNESKEVFILSTNITTNVNKDELVDEKIQSTSKIATFSTNNSQIVNKTVTDSSFDFTDYNYSVSTTSEPDPLFSLSLIKPITQASNVNTNEIQFTNANNAIYTNTTVQEMASTQSSTGIRNPYPYGPKFMDNLPYNERLRPIEPPSIKELLPKEDLFYDYEYPESTPATTNEKDFIVKTEKPTILFHFDKPGYTPVIPKDLIPPTRLPTPSDPEECTSKCPQYTLLDWNPDYDIRHYPPTVWISTVIISKNRILAELEGYMRIQDYFYGLNDQGEVIKLTVPTITQIRHGRHPTVKHETSEYAVSLFMNHKEDSYDYLLPTPISNEVLIERLDRKTVFASRFEANLWELTDEYLKTKAEKLMNKLQQNGEAFLDRYFYLAAYGRPELYQPVYFEIWIYATKFRNSQPSGPAFPSRQFTPSKLTLRTREKLCRGIECPSFEVLRTYRYGIQKRRYFDGILATTNIDDCQFTTSSVWKGFMPLHLYKHGINSHMEVIEATRPIALVHVMEDYHSDCPQNMTMGIYLPKRLHGNPPLTGYAAPRVAVKSFQNLVVYAYTVGGYLLEPNRVRRELSDLKYRLSDFGACFKETEYYVVVYDFIVRYHGRQNEIWIVAENCKATKNRK